MLENGLFLFESPRRPVTADWDFSERWLKGTAEKQNKMLFNQMVKICRERVQYERNSFVSIKVVDTLKQ